MPCRVQGVTYMNLGKRLSAALELLAECDGSIVADIGSDHAYLAVAALKSGALAAYGADVVSKEPIAADNPLLSAPNCYLTPHIAWAPKETRQRLHHIAAENLRAFLEGHPQNVVS